MDKFIIKGGRKLMGEVEISGAKNAAVAILPAVILADEPCVIENVPNISDVSISLRILYEMGARVDMLNETTYRIDPRGILNYCVPYESARQMRASYYFLGALLGKYHKARVSMPGGCPLGDRPIDQHLKAFTALGAQDSVEYGQIHVRAEHLSGGHVFFDTVSVGATMNAMLAAVLAEGTTVLENVAREPHIVDLANFLNMMGADVHGAGTDVIKIHGVESLHGAEFTIDADHIEAASFLCMAAATGGSVELTGPIIPRHYWMTRRVLERFNIKFKLEPGHIWMPGNQKMKVVKDIGNAIPMISDGPWPQFPSDMMSCLIVAATQARGSVLFFEKMFESRICFVDRIIAMGANAIVCDPHRVVISGPAKLRGITMASPDIRAGMAMIIAGACAKGTSVINCAEIIFRGYENLPGKLTALGVRNTLAEV